VKILIKTLQATIYKTNNLLCKVNFFPAKIPFSKKKTKEKFGGGKNYFAKE
jgi:hypothetical protein